MTRLLVLLVGCSLLTLAAAPATAHASSGLTFAKPAPSLELEDGDDRDALMVKLSMAQFHHLRAMHGITWAMVGLLTTPGVVVLGGGVLIAGAVSGALGGGTGALVAGVVVVLLAATVFVVSVPVLIGNIIQATATAARVEALRAKLLADQPAAFRPPPPSDRAGVVLAFAF